MQDLSELKIDRELVSYIKQVVDPIMVANSLGISLDKRNRAACPVHGGDNRTAFSIDEKTGRWSCFSHGCHNGRSDMVGLVMLMRRCSFVEAIKFMATIAGINIEADHDEEIRKALLNKDTNDFVKRSDNNYVDNELAFQFEEEIYYMQKYRTDYFYKHGYSKAVLDYFEVGHGKDRFGIPREYFPLRNKEGTIVALDGRRTDGDSEPRYSVWPPGFSKGSMLYHYDRAKDYIYAFRGVLFIVEGYKACWSMIQAGLMNTVAAMGAGLTKEQPKLILENINIEKVVLIFDGDEAGRNATVRNKRELAHMCNIDSISMQYGQDPSTLDLEALRELTYKYMQ